MKTDRSTAVPIRSATPTRAPRSLLRFNQLGRHLAGDLDHAWPLDAVNAAAVTAGLLTHSVVIWFHIVFLVQAVAALLLPFRRFALRCAIWTVVSAALVAYSVIQGQTPAVELSELPLLTTVLILVYLGAQARSHVVEQLTIAQQVEVQRSHHELESLRHQVEQAQHLELLGRASLSSAHDLRNVFAVISGCASELNEEMYGRRAATRVLEILNATDRAMAIVSDLQETGLQRPMGDGPVDLRAMAHHLEPLLRRLTPSDITLEMVCADQSIRVRMDRTSLLQILMNLVVNATDAIDGAGVVRVRCERVVRQRPGMPMSRASAVLSVSDTGPGIAEDVLAQVFEPGFSTKSGDHSGLGLATVWRIVDRWHGSVDIESSPGAGTTVRVELPLFDHRERRHALVVVHDARARQLVVEELVELDFDVVEASEALEACDLVTENRIVDLAVLDEACAADRGLAEVAHLASVPSVHVLGKRNDPERRLPTNRVDAAWLVGVMVSRSLAAYPVESGESRADPLGSQIN